MSRLSTRIDLLRGLWGGERAVGGPFFATVDLTSRCNLRCVGCPCHAPGSENPSNRRAITDLDSALFAGFCEDLATMNVGLLVLSGEGEPLLHPDLFELLRRAKSAVSEVLLFTNGTLLDEGMAEALVQSGLDKIRVSLWAGSRAEYEANCAGTDGRYFDRVVDGLRNLTSAKARLGKNCPRVIVHSVLNRNNYRGVKAFAEMAVEARVNAVSFSPMRVFRGKASQLTLSPDEEQSLRASLLEIKPLLHSAGLGDNIDETLFRYDAGANACQVAPCYIGWMHARVKLDGSVQPCNPTDRVVGNLNETPFRDIWNNTEFRVFRKQTLACDDEFSNGAFCDCSYCCHISQNLKVDRVFKWFKPFQRALRG